MAMNEFCKHNIHESHYCGSCNQEVVTQLKEENAELKRKLEKAVEALEKVPNYSNYILCIVETEKALKSIRGD